MAPISVAAVIERRCPRCKGVSRTIITSLRRSLSVTSAARVKRVDVIPVTTSPMVRIEHGAINMPMVLCEPEAMLAPTSPMGCTSSANWRTSSAFKSVSNDRVNSADLLITR